MTKLTKIDVADVEPLLKKLAEHGTAKQELSDEAVRLLAKINPTPPTLVGLLEKKVLQNGMSKSLYEEYGSMLDLAREQELRIKTLVAEKAVLETSKKAQGEEIIRLVEVAAKRYDALKKIAYWSSTVTLHGSTYAQDIADVRRLAAKSLNGV